LLQQKYRNTGNAAFTYDIDNHLLTGSAPTAATFTYDPFGRRWTDTGPTYFVPFIYDGPNLAMEYYSGAVLRRYVPSGLGVDQPLVWYEGAGTSTPRWLQADNLGSVVAYSDASGNQHVTTGYGPFGEVPNFYSTRYEYTGQLNIPELNLFDFKARAYDPNLGRFLSADPAGYASDINSYAYVGNDPVNGTDPSGMTDIAEVSKVDVFSLPPLTLGLFGAVANLKNGLNGGDETYEANVATVNAEGVNFTAWRRQAEEAVRAHDSNDAGDATTVRDVVVTAVPTPETTLSGSLQIASTLTDKCIGECYHILERSRPPGSDKPKYDFHRCVDECIARNREGTNARTEPPANVGPPARLWLVPILILLFPPVPAPG
jgi:RHS repeat-associated protein